MGNNEETKKEFCQCGLAMFFGAIADIEKEKTKKYEAWQMITDNLYPKKRVVLTEKDKQVITIVRQSWVRSEGMKGYCPEKRERVFKNGIADINREEYKIDYETEHTGIYYVEVYRRKKR